MTTIPKTIRGVAERFNLDLEDVREGPDGMEVTSVGAGVILDMQPSSVRRRYYRGDIDGEVKGRDMWLSLTSVLQYAKVRKPAGRPIENGAGLRRRRKTAGAGKSGSPRKSAKKSKAGKKVVARKK